jgi:hypothetical protein
MTIVRFFTVEKLRQSDMESNNPPRPNIIAKKLNGNLTRGSALKLVVARSKRISKVGTAQNQSTDT